MSPGAQKRNDLQRIESLQDNAPLRANLSEQSLQVFGISPNDKFRQHTTSLTLLRARYHQKFIRENVALFTPPFNLSAAPIKSRIRRSNRIIFTEFGARQPAPWVVYEAEQ